MRLPPSIAAALRRFVRRATADYAFRIRHRDGLFEVHERSGGAWRVRGLFLSYSDAEHIADGLVRDRSRGGATRRGASCRIATGSCRQDDPAHGDGRGMRVLSPSVSVSTLCGLVIRAPGFESRPGLHRNRDLASGGAAGE